MPIGVTVLIIIGTLYLGFHQPEPEPPVEVVLDKPLGVIKTVAQLRDDKEQEQSDYFTDNGRYDQVQRYTRNGKEIRVDVYEASERSYNCQKAVRDSKTSCFGYQIIIKEGATTTSTGYGVEAEGRTWIRVVPEPDLTASST